MNAPTLNALSMHMHFNREQSYLLFSFLSLVPFIFLCENDMKKRIILCIYFNNQGQ